MITNTTKEIRNNPSPGLMTSLPGGIEAQEAQGQRELVNPDVLPINIGEHRGENMKAKYEALGFVFGKVVDGDPIFQHAALPKGWKRQGSNHSMWSHIVDERGLKRVAIFYKAAFYDRSAHMSLCNVGYELASDFIWAEEGEPTIPTGLTPDEIAEAKKACDGKHDLIREDRCKKFLAALP